jgi:predicted phage gp36 major capsid-like protein
MEKMLQAIGASGPLLVAVLVLVLGWRIVKAILEAWENLLAKMKTIAVSGVEAHVREHHASDEGWKEEVRSGFRDSAAELRRLEEQLRREHADRLADFEKQVRGGFTEIGKDVRKVHERIDEYLTLEAQAKRRDGTWIP